MTNRGAARLAWSLWALALAFVVGGALLSYLNRSTLDSTTEGFYLILSLSAIGFGTAGALVAVRHRNNPIGWLFLAMAIGFVAGEFSEEYAIRGLVTAPGSLPAVRWIAYPNNYLWGLSFELIALVFLLFPSGRPASSRWRIVTWTTVALLAVDLVGGIFDDTTTVGNNNRLSRFHATVANPLGIHALKGVMGVAYTVVLVGLFAADVAAVASLIQRWRRSTGEERQQVRWLAYVGASAVGSILFIPAAVATRNQVFGVLFWFSFTSILCLGIPIASGIAILKYRLYDLDVVIKKTVVFGVLVGFVTVVYVAVVVGVGAVVGTKGNGTLTLAAAVIVALAFQPIRARARHLADRIVYGKRATPYEVLSELSGRLAGAYSTEDVLPRMVQILSAGTGATTASVWLRVGDELRPAASWPPGETGPAGPLLLDGENLPGFPGGDPAFPVRHQGELLGAITIALPPTEPLTPSQEKLIQDLASQAGLVLRNVRLTGELRAYIEELRASRQRIVTAQDARAKALERNIHDGAQQQLVALAVKLRLAESMVGHDAEKERRMLGELQAETTEALENLRDLARGIYPPLLADQGLPAALRAQARKAAVSVTVEAGFDGRYPQEVEAAVYFCCLEALQNVAKYSHASCAVVRLSAEEHQLEFAVEDDGEGFDPRATPLGTGLQGMVDRVEALGGTLEVRSQPGRGTTVVGRIPTRQVRSVE